MGTDERDERREAEALAQGYLSGRLSRGQLFSRAGRLSALAVATSSLGSVLAACGGGASATTAGTAAGTQKRGGTLQAALTGEPDSLDPAVSAIYTGAQVYDNIFSKLVDLDEHQKFYGVLATHWSNPDPKTWVFDLRSGVRFHNGEPFSAADVKYTFERILDPKTASSYAGLYSAIASVEAPSPTRVVFHLKSPFGPFLTNLANNGEIVNQKAIEGGNPARNPVGTGPFKFVEWVQGDHVTVTRNPHYFEQGKPFLDGIRFRFLPVDQGRIDGLRSGDLDWVDAVPLQQLPSVKTDPTFTYVTSSIAGIPDFLAMNTTKPPFNNPSLRRAVALAVNKDEIRTVAYFGAGENGSLEVPTQSTWYDKSADPYASGPQIDKARSLMKSAGLSSVNCQYLGLPQYPELLKTGEVVQDQLKQIGINMSIEQVDVSVWFDRFSKLNYQITSAYQERTIDPDNFYSLVIHSGAPINTTGYDDKTVDKLIDQAAASTDTAQRKRLYNQIRRKVLTDAPIVFVHYETINYLMRKNVVGSTINPTLELRMGNVSMA